MLQGWFGCFWSEDILLQENASGWQWFYVLFYVTGMLLVWRDTAAGECFWLTMILCSVLCYRDALDALGLKTLLQENASGSQWFYVLFYDTGMLWMIVVWRDTAAGESFWLTMILCSVLCYRDALDALNLKRYCCRRMLLAHNDFMFCSMIQGCFGCSWSEEILLQEKASGSQWFYVLFYVTGMLWMLLVWRDTAAGKWFYVLFCVTGMLWMRLVWRDTAAGECFWLTLIWLKNFSTMLP